MKHQAASLMHDRIIPTVFDMSDPGTGKTAVRIWAFAKRRSAGSGALLVLCPRSLTRSAWANDFAKFAPEMRVSVATAENRAQAFDEEADVYVTNHDAAKWLAAQPKQFFAKFSELVVDECFPAGTPVDTPTGPRPIEQIAVGDLVLTSAGELPVTNTFVSYSDILVRLRFDDGTSFDCTPNHPIATNRGWRPAGGVCEMSVVRLALRKHPQPEAALLLADVQQDRYVAEYFASGKSCANGEDSRVSAGQAVMERWHPVPRRNEATAQWCSLTDRSQANAPWGQRQGRALRGLSARNAFKGVDTAVRDSDEAAAGLGVSNELSRRLRQSETQDSAGDRRQFTHIAQNLGRQEDRISSLSRVVSVTRIEQSSPCRVYNLQVDGPHDYSVRGTLVHNCTAFKHHTSLRSKALRKLVSHKLNGRPIFNRRALLSATPTSNGICDIWHQVALLDDGKRLGNSFYAFRNEVSTPTQVGRNVNALKWEDKEGAEEAVFSLIQDLVIRHRFEDCVDIPARHIYSVKYTLTSKQLRAYEDMEQAQLLVFKDKKKMTAVNAAAVSTKLLQIASGAVYDNDGEYHVVDTARYELIMDLAEARVRPIVFFFWKHQVAALVKEAEKRGMSYAVFDGEASDKRRAEIEAAYQAKQYDVLFAHPKSTAHGLTLTAGTSIIWSGPTADLEWFLQGNRRQARIGQTKKTEVVVVLAEGTYDERVYHEILMPKDGRMKTLLELFS